ncbi:MAG: restriction endonuclease subunit S [Thiobacillaceae bacterium]
MSGWQKTTVGKVATGFLSGGTPTTSRADFWKGEIPWITSKWLGDKLELTTGEKFVSEEAVKKTATKIVPKDSIIFATRVGVGKVGINRIDLAINQDLAGVLIDNEHYDIKFLAYQLGIDSIQQYVAMNKRGATIKGITRDCLEQIRLNLPLLPEQKKIAHILSTVQRAIEAQERIIQTTTELKKALMHKLFTEGLRNEPQKQTEIGPVPESWEVKPLIDTVEFIDYGVSQAIPKTPTPGGVKIVSTADIDKQGNLLYWKIRRIVVPAKTANRLVLKDGDVLFNWRNSAELIGKSAIYEEQDEPHIFASFILRICAGEKKSHNYFLKHLMNHYREEGVFVKLARRAVNQANYNKNEISVLKIPSPPYEQQVEIAQAIGAADSKIWSHVDKKRGLEDLFRTLLHELMTAKTRVHKLEVGKGAVA